MSNAGSPRINETSSRTSRAEKLLRLALDPAASDGEIVQACRAYQRMVREADMDPLALLTAREADCPDARLPFGKYRGQLVSVIFRHDPDYLVWLCETIQPRGRRFNKALEFWRGKLREAA